MMRWTLLAITLGAAILLSGCQTARYVLKEGDEGIVAIPSNSSWPVDHREKARELMRDHFPNGYTIEREEEVPVGNETATHAGEFSTITQTRDTTEWRISYRRMDRTQEPAEAVGQ